MDDIHELLQFVAAMGLSETQAFIGAILFTITVVGVAAAAIRDVRKANAAAIATLRDANEAAHTVLREEVQKVHTRVSNERKEMAERVKEWKFWTDERIKAVEAHIKELMQVHHTQVMAELSKISEDVKSVPDNKARIHALERITPGANAQRVASSGQP